MEKKKERKGTNSYIALLKFCTSCMISIALSVNRLAVFPCERTPTSCKIVLYSPKPTINPSAVVKKNFIHQRDKPLLQTVHRSHHTLPM